MAATPAYTIALTRRVPVAEGTMAFHFAKPSGFEFRPGQSVDLTLVDPPETDAEGNIRTFSLVSAPFDNELIVATRMRDTAFKRVLRNAEIGHKLQLEGPGGSFTLHRKTEKPAVLLAGGIGITPFMSMIRQASHDNSACEIYLFYSNRRPHDAAYLDALTETARSNSRFHLIATITDIQDSLQGWKGERGHIDRNMLSRHLPTLAGPIFYLAGPPAMVTAMREMLVDAGADEDDVRSEEFAGY